MAGKGARRAEAELWRRAWAGEVEALYVLGRRAVFLDEPGVRRPSRRVGILWLRRAAAQGHVVAMTVLANALTRGPKRSQAALREAIHWESRAARAGGDGAPYNLAVSWRLAGFPRVAVRHFRALAAKGGDDAHEAELQLAGAELLGIGTRRDVTAALRRLVRVARSRTVSAFENQEAMLLLAELYRAGWLVPNDFPRALKWLRRAARIGSAAAAGLLRDLGAPLEPTTRSTGSAPSGADAALWQRAWAGEPDALYELGALGVDDDAVQQRRPSRRLALAWLRRAAEAGHVGAMEELATALSRGPKRAPAALREAMRWERRAARLGSTLAPYNIGVSWRLAGRPRQAVRAFRALAATGGHDAHEAEFELARAELLGVGTRRDVPSALRRLERVARSRTVCLFDNEQAMVLLAEVYRTGWLVPVDFPRTLKWLRKAAGIGSAAAAGLLQDLGEPLESPARRPR